MAGYDLGDVKPWVENAAELLGDMFGIRRIGGWRATGSVPNSDHPKGLALDMMTSSKAVGDRLAAYAIANYKALGIKYVIWYRRIWHPGKGWKKYTGPSSHTDHVHLSFNSAAGSGKPSGIGSALGAVLPGTLLPTPIQDGIKGIGDQLKTIAGGVVSVGKVAELVTSLFLPNAIMRGAAGLAGTMLVLIGIFFLSREARSDG